MVVTSTLPPNPYTSTGYILSTPTASLGQPPPGERTGTQPTLGASLTAGPNMGSASTRTPTLTAKKVAALQTSQAASTSAVKTIGTQPL